MRAVLCALTLSLAVAPSSAEAALVSVNIPDAVQDINTNRDDTFGAFMEDDATYVWNDILASSGVASATLEDTDGGATGITFTTTYTLIGPNWGPPNDGVLEEGVTNSNQSAISMTIHGLVTGTTYDLVVISSTVHHSETQTVEGIGPTAFLNELAGAINYIDGTSYDCWSATAVGGELDWIGTGAAFDSIAGFQIREAAAAVPEPSTLVLAGIGLLGLVACGRRRNRRRA